MTRRLARIVASVAASSALGCEALLSGSTPGPDLPAAPAAPPRPQTCADWEPTSAADTPSAADLSALLGHLESAPEVERAMTRLGMSRVESDRGVTVHTYEARGLQLFFRSAPAGNRLVSVRMWGRASDASAFSGALPGGLSFTQTEAEADAALGGPARPYCWLSGCRYQDRGWTVWSDRQGCLSSVEMTRPLAKDEVLVEDVEVRENVEHGGAHGVSVTFTRTEPHVAGYTLTTTTLCLEDEGGKPRKQPRWIRPRAEEQGPLCFPARGTGFGETANANVFIPYSHFEQTPGAFVLKGSFLSILEPYRSLSGSGGPRLPLRNIGEARVEARVLMPELRHARAAVKRVEVDKDRVYDDVNTGWIAAAIVTGGASALVPVPERWKKPDLQWSVYTGGVRAYRSAAHDDAYSGAWSAASSPVPLAPGDTFSICVEDSDGADMSDQIGCFDFTLESYAEHVKSGKPLSGGGVKKLVLGR